MPRHNRFTDQIIPNDQVQRQRRGMTTFGTTVPLPTRIWHRPIEQAELTPANATPPRHMVQSTNLDFDTLAHSLDIGTIAEIRSSPTSGFRERARETLTREFSWPQVSAYSRTQLPREEITTAQWSRVPSDRSGVAETETETETRAWREEAARVRRINSDLGQRMMQTEIRNTELLKIAQQLHTYALTKHDSRFVHYMQSDREGCPQCQHLANLQAQLERLGSRPLQ